MSKMSRSKLTMLPDLAGGGEVVFFEEGGTRIVVADLLSHTVASVELPLPVGIEGIHFASRESWVLTTTDGSIYGFSSPPSDFEHMPSILTPLRSDGGLRGLLPDLVAPRSAGDALTPTRAVSSRSYFGGRAVDLCDVLVHGGASAIEAHPRARDNRYSASMLAYAAASDTLVSMYPTLDPIRVRLPPAQPAQRTPQRPLPIPNCPGPVVVDGHESPRYLHATWP